MPASFWKSQNPDNDPKVGWALCCATVKAMLAAFYGKGRVPNERYDLVQEHRSTAWAHGLRVRDGYVPAPNAARAAQGLERLDRYMALKKPVIVGVSHTVNLLFYSKKTKTYREINDGTADHFVAIVGTGADKIVKYYRFFGVETINANKANGIDPSDRLYNADTYAIVEFTPEAALRGPARHRYGTWAEQFRGIAAGTGVAALNGVGAAVEA